MFRQNPKNRPGPHFFLRWLHLVTALGASVLPRPDGFHLIKVATSQLDPVATPTTSLTPTLASRSQLQHICQRDLSTMQPGMHPCLASDQLVLPSALRIELTPLPGPPRPQKQPLSPRPSSLFLASLPRCVGSFLRQGLCTCLALCESLFMGYIQDQAG